MNEPPKKDQQVTRFAVGTPHKRKDQNGTNVPKQQQDIQQPQ